MQRRTLVLGGGFGGAQLARMLGERGATVVSPSTSMLYTPLLAEVAAGAIEPRHVAVPLRQMCPHADLVLGRATGIDEGARTVEVETERGATELRYDRLVVALGAVPRLMPVPGLVEHGLGFKTLGDAIALRDHVLRRLEAADSDPAGAERHLTFVFVGAGYAGVEACAEMLDLVAGALPHYPRLARLRQRWVLVNAGDRILPETPRPLGDYAARQLEARGVEIRGGVKLAAVDARSATLSDGTRVPSETVVWTAGVRPHPLVAELGLPLHDDGRIAVDPFLRVEGRSDVWALGDCAHVPNETTPGAADPPTCQHALRQARRLARNLSGRPAPYRYRSRGQAATLGRDRGIAAIGPMRLRGRPAGLMTRAMHVAQLPLRSRRLRVLADGTLSMAFNRDMVELGMLDRTLERTVSKGARA
ncbi:MAG TPA: NAD(P)/FAD-dependent oxidoreductase [Thermoleophilaceae bacterium]|jgi:NADH dehydrogenase